MPSPTESTLKDIARLMQQQNAIFTALNINLCAAAKSLEELLELMKEKEKANE